MAALLVADTLHKPAAPSMDGVAGDAERGAYMVRVAGCVACHTDREGKGAPLAGGRRLTTDFGTFVTPNITSSVSAGIGAWSLDDLVLAMTAGVSPAGEHYYPAFPYPTYTRMTLRDTAGLKAWLDSVAPVDVRPEPHELVPPLQRRPLLAAWKALFFRPGRFVPNKLLSAEFNRGAYLVNGPAHCIECHTQRNLLGALSGEHLGGTAEGPSGEPVPSINPAYASGLENWTAEDITFALQVGIKADGDAVGGEMGEVVDDSTGHFTDADLAAAAAYLLRQTPDNRSED